MADETRTSEVAARYAQALFDLGAQADALAAIETDLKAFQALAGESRDLQALLASPRFAAESKAAALAEIGERAGFSTITRNFMGLVAANRRVGRLLEMIAAFRGLLAARRGVASALVTTAAPMSPAQRARLEGALAQALGKAPEIDARVDPGLLGGLKVRIGSRLFDASLKARLDAMKFALARA